MCVLQKQADGTGPFFLRSHVRLASCGGRLEWRHAATTCCGPAAGGGQTDPATTYGACGRSGVLCVVPRPASFTRSPILRAALCRSGESSQLEPTDRTGSTRIPRTGRVFHGSCYRGPSADCWCDLFSAGASNWAPTSCTARHHYVFRALSVHPTGLGDDYQSRSVHQNGHTGRDRRPSRHPVSCLFRRCTHSTNIVLKPELKHLFGCDADRVAAYRVCRAWWFTIWQDSLERSSNTVRSEQIHPRQPFHRCL